MAAGQVNIRRDAYEEKWKSRKYMEVDQEEISKLKDVAFTLHLILGCPYVWKCTFS